MIILSKGTRTPTDAVALRITNPVYFYRPDFIILLASLNLETPINARSW